MNKAILTGYLAADPAHQYTRSNKAVCTFRIGVPRRFTNAQGIRESDFFPVVAWGKLADIAARYLTKGSRVGVAGTLQTRSYEDKNGVKRYVTEIVADEIEFLSSAKGEGDNPSGAFSATSPVQGGFTQVEDDELPF